MKTSLKMLLNRMFKLSSVLHWLEWKNWCYKSYVREKCIRKAFFHFFTGTKAHCKQIDPEGRTRFLSCRRILLLKSLAWERPSSFDLCARLSKVQSRNLELITLLQYFFGQLCYVSLIGFGSLYFGGIWEYFPDAYPGNAFCLEYWQVLQGLPVLLLWSWEPTVPLVSFWQDSLWNPWAAVQLMHSCTKFKSQLSLGLLPLLLFPSVIVGAGYFCLLKGLS